MINRILSNWKSTVFAIVLVITGIVFEILELDYMEFILVLVAALGLLYKKD